MSDQTIYKVIFTQQSKVFELYAKEIGEDELLGFIQVSDILLSGPDSVVADPSEAEIKAEFENVETTLIPMHSIIRIDIVNRQGPAKIVDGDTNVRHFPSSSRPKDKS